MTKRVVIAGSRDFTNYIYAKRCIDICLSKIRQNHTVVILSGGARGADTLGERYAAENGLCVERYPADWDTHGRGAGLIRNRQMAEACDYAICFWDGVSRGTKSMIEYAKQNNKPIRVIRI